MPLSFDARNWYWIVGGSTTQVFSSAVGNYVAVSDPTYQAWLASGGRPASKATEQELYDYLVALGVDPGVLVDSVTVPECPLWAFHAALAGFAGGDKESVYETWITANKATRINLYFQWKHASKIKRDSNLVGSVANNTSLTVQQMNGIFSDAVKRAANSGVS